MQTHSMSLWMPFRGLADDKQDGLKNIPTAIV
jgi:hypothetical protein